MPDLPPNPARSPSFYITSGTLPLDSQSYVARQADEDLLGALLAGEYCFVLNSRQMGKSSLCVRTIAKLQEAGAKTVFLDLTKIGGSNVTPEQWYIGLLSETGRALGLRKEFLDYWKQNSEYSLIQRYIGALHDVALTRTSSPLVLFIDEIDAVKSLSFSTDEFFAAIRECYNRRVHEPEYRRLAFALVGSATPSDLIQDTRTSPFNIGRQIELKDFTLEEMLHLAEGFIGPVSPTGTIADRVLERVYYRTNGHPYLTQILCKAISEALNASTPTLGDRPPKSPKIGGFRGPIPRPTQRPTPKLVDCLVSTMFFEAKARERNVNLADVSNRILSSYINADRREENRAAILDLYRQVWGRRKRVVDDETNPLITRLKLSGITTGVQGELRVRNRIYERVFDKAWIDQNMPDAELRRQKAAYRQGLYRAATIASVVLLAMVGLTAWAFQQRNKAIVARRDADAKTIEARRLSYEAYASSMEVAKSAWDFGNVGAVRKALWASRTQARRGFEYGYLTRLCNLAQRTLRGHTDKVEAVAYLNGGKRLLTASMDGTVRLWDASTGEPLRAYRNATEGIWTMACSNDERWLATAGKGGHISIRNLATGEEIYDCRASQSDNINYVSFSQNNRLLASAGADGSTKLWDVQTGKLLRAFQGQPGSVAFSPNGRMLATADKDNVAILWDIASGRKIRTFRGEANRGQSSDLQSVAFSPDGSLLATASADHTARLWRVTTGECVHILQGNGGFVLSVVFSPNGSRCATANDDGTARLWDVRTGVELKRFTGHEGQINMVAFAPDGQHLATVSDDKTAKVWDAASRTGDDTLAANLWPITQAVFSPDSKMAATASEDGTIRLWNAQSDTQMRFFHAQNVKKYFSAAFSPDGQRLVVSGSTMPGTCDPDNMMTWILDAKSGRELIPPLKNCIFGVLSRDGKLLATTPELHSIQIRDLQTGRELFTLPAQGRSVAFSPDGKRLLVCGITGSADAKVYDLQSKNVILSLKNHTEQVRWVDYSHDGKWLATANADKSAKIWDAKTGQERYTLTAHTGEVTCVAFSPDSNQVLTCGTDGQVILWDVATGLQLLALTTGTPVSNAAFSPDGKRIIAALPNGTARIWERYTENEIAVSAAAESADAARMAHEKEQIAEDKRIQAAARFARLRAQVPRRDAHAGSNLIDLAGSYNALFDYEWINDPTTVRVFAAFPRGVHTFAGTPFDVRGIVQIDGQTLDRQGLNYPQRVPAIPIRRTCKSLECLIGTYYPEDDGVTEGQWVLHYANGQTRAVPIVYGHDVRVVWLWLGEATGGGTIAWTTVKTKGALPATLYKVSIVNSQLSIPIDSLDFVSTMSNSSPFLIAITAE